MTPYHWSLSDKSMELERVHFKIPGGEGRRREKGPPRTLGKYLKLRLQVPLRLVGVIGRHLDYLATRDNLPDEP